MEALTTAVQPYSEAADKVYKDIGAELVFGTIPQIVNIRQYDESMPILRVKLSAGGLVYTLPAGSACNIRMSKPDGTYVYNPALGCSSDRTIVYFAVTQQMALVAGKCPAIIEIYKDGTLGTSTIMINVVENPVPEDAIISQDEFQTFMQAVAVLDEAASKIDDAMSAAEDAAESASQAQGYASQAATSASNASGSATAAASSASAASGSASDAADSATAAGTSASTAASSATAASGSATAAAGSASDAAGSASNAATSESNAASSASAAAGSATSAATSAGDASQSASDAADSATAAATSESNAASSASDAADYYSQIQTAIHTALTPQFGTIQFDSYTNNFNSYVVKSGNTVVLMLNMSAKIARQANAYFATLPGYFRPHVNMYINAMTTAGRAGRIGIQPDGQIQTNVALSVDEGYRVNVAFVDIYS